MPAVGGSTEEFDRHWDSLKEEEKNVRIYIFICHWYINLLTVFQKYIERSKQLVS